MNLILLLFILFIYLFIFYFMYYALIYFESSPFDFNVELYD